MDELAKFLPTPPQLGPPLPSFLETRWPWQKQSPEKEYVTPLAGSSRAGHGTGARAGTEPVTVAVTQRAVNYEMESPPELIHELSPIRIDPSWLQGYPQQ